MIYKEKEGYVIYSPMLTFHSGNFECKAKLNGTTDKLQIFAIYNREFRGPGTALRIPNIISLT